MYRIRTFNQIAQCGLDRFPRDRYQVGGDLADPHGILLRSHKLAPNWVGGSLHGVARAGAGLNNVPVELCTERGVVVFNTPGANANSVKELVLIALLTSSRDVLGGMRFVRSLSNIADEAALNAKVEAEKRRFRGRELAGKSLGVVGLGAIGSLVAQAALGLGMKVLGYDPAISVDAAWRLPSSVRRMEHLISLFQQCDFVTLHVPLLPETRGLIDDQCLGAFRPGGVLLNFAREPIVHRGALKRALDGGALAGYMADFPVPGLADHPKVRCTPHLGASTQEAEENCARMAADRLRNFLETGAIVNSVNFPNVELEQSPGHRLAIVNRNVPGMLGQVTSMFAKRGINVIDMINKSRGAVAYNLLDLADKPVPALLEQLRVIDSVLDVRSLPPA